MISIQYCRYSTRASHIPDKNTEWLCWPSDNSVPLERATLAHQYHTWESVRSAFSSRIALQPLHNVIWDCNTILLRDTPQQKCTFFQLPVHKHYQRMIFNGTEKHLPRHLPMFVMQVLSVYAAFIATVFSISTLEGYVPVGDCKNISIIYLFNNSKNLQCASQLHGNCAMKSLTSHCPRSFVQHSYCMK